MRIDVWWQSKGKEGKRFDEYSASVEDGGRDVNKECSSRS